MSCSTPGAGHCGDLVREIVAWFDVMHSRYVVDGTPVELSEEWPFDWLRRARDALVEPTSRETRQSLAVRLESER